MYEGPMYERVEQKKQRSFAACEPAGARTQDPILKRDVLYLLSYWFSSLFGPQTLRWFTSRGTMRIVRFSKSGCKGTAFFWHDQIFLKIFSKKVQFEALKAKESWFLVQNYQKSKKIIRKT